MNKLTLAGLLLIGFNAVAMENQERTGKITPETLVSLMSPMSSEKQEAIDAWVDEHGRILQKCNEMTTFRDWRVDLKNKNELLESNGLANKDVQGWGDIIVHMDKDHEAELAGMVNRRQNIIQYQGAMTKSDRFQSRPRKDEAHAARMLQKIRKFHDKQFEQYQANSVPTYQNMSNAAHAVLLYNAKDQHNLHTLYIPKINVVPFDKEYKGPANDKTHVIVRERVYGVRPAEAKDFTPEQVRQLLLACKYSYIYSLDDAVKILIRDEDGAIVLPWTKQRNATNANDFFLKDMEKARMCSVFAMRDVVNRTKGNKEAFAAAQEFVRNNRDLETAILYSELLNAAELNK